MLIHKSHSELELQFHARSPHVITFFGNAAKNIKPQNRMLAHGLLISGTDRKDVFIFSIGA